MGPSRQTQIDVVDRNRFGPLQTDTELILQADTDRRGALASTKNRYRFLQADTSRHGALVSTN